MNQETKSPFPTSDTVLKATTSGHPKGETQTISASEVGSLDALFGKTVLVVGAGSAGAEIAAKLSQYGIVCVMNTAFGNPAGDLADFGPMPDVSTLTESHFDLVVWNRLTKQCSNVSDEINELEKAIREEDWINIRDSLCDVRVFGYGGAHFMGYDIDKDTTYPAAQHEHWAAGFLRRTDPVTALRAAQSHLMLAINQRQIEGVKRALQQLIYISEQSAHKLGITTATLDMDMRAVIDGVMTRFIKDEADKQATIKKHAAKGVTDVYFEGEYPVMIMKSASDQPDAPVGKFMKSASFKEAKFAEVAYDLEVAGAVITGVTLAP
jgi:hypothetical protein